MATALRTAACLVLALSVTPGWGPAGTLSAQEMRVLRLARPQAWVGFSFELRETWRSGSQRSSVVMVVTDVHPDSPARRAGLQVGDTVLTLNRAPVDHAALSRLQAGLAPGTPVSFTLRREGRVRDVSLTAQTRPADEMLISLSPEVRVQLDSAHALFVKQLESARGGPGSGDAGSLSDDGQRTLIWRTLGTGDQVPGGWITFPDPAFAPPFPSLLVGDARSQALRDRLTELEGEMRQVRLEQAKRTQELARQGSARAQQDAVIRQQVRRQDEIRREAERVKRELERLADATLSRAASQVSAASRAATVSARAASPTPAAESYGRLLTPYLTGQDRVAGARLTPLNPDLGAYFGVERGLLVVEVGAGTPAAEGGMLPGDVVVRVGGRETSTLDQLRRGLAGSSPARLTVVRKGRRVELVLPR